MCLYPKKIWSKPYKNDNGKFVRQLLNVKCGKCVECLKSQSKEWAFRLALESKNHSSSIFLTLTYNKENLPKDGELCKRDVQLFLKRLRSKISPLKIRFFCCGEYGSRGNRPHYHLCIFGFAPDDSIKKFTRDGVDYFTSSFLEKIWQKGFILFSMDITPKNAIYCAKYMQKLNSIKNKVVKPYICMSNRPGIGYYSIDLKFLEDDRIYINGDFISVPRYFLKVFDRAGIDLTTFKSRRIELGKIFEKCRNFTLARRKENFLKKFSKNS